LRKEACKTWGKNQQKKIAYLLVLPLELIDEMVDKTVVKVLTTQVSITSSRFDFKDTLLDGQKRDIEGPSSQVENEHVSLALSPLVETISDSSGSRLVDDTEHIEASDETSIFGGLTLGVVEVGWDSHNGVVDGASEVGFGGLPHLGQDHGRDFFWCEQFCLALELDLDLRLAGLVDDLEREVLHVGLHFSICEFASDETLGIEDCVGRVHGDLVFGRVPNQTLCVGEGNEGWSGTIALVIGDNFDTVITKHTGTTIGCAQVDTNGWSHDVWLVWCSM